MLDDDFKDLRSTGLLKNPVMDIKNTREKMDTQKPKGDLPKYKGDGVAVWENEDKNGNTYLTINLLGRFGIKVNAFLNIPKDDKQEQLKEE